MPTRQLGICSLGHQARMDAYLARILLDLRIGAVFCTVCSHKVRPISQRIHPRVGLQVQTKSTECLVLV